MLIWASSRPWGGLRSALQLCPLDPSLRVANTYLPSCSKSGSVSPRASVSCRGVGGLWRALGLICAQWTVTAEPRSRYKPQEGSSCNDVCVWSWWIVGSKQLLVNSLWRKENIFWLFPQKGGFYFINHNFWSYSFAMWPKDYYIYPDIHAFKSALWYFLTLFFINKM